MYIIVEGYAYLVDGSTGYRISFNKDGQMVVNQSSTISVTTQKKYTYDEMIRKINAAKSVESLRKTYIVANGDSEDLSNLIDNLTNEFKDNKDNLKKLEKVIYGTVEVIEDKSDDCIITFDKNGGTGTMKQVRKEVGDKYELPTCKFTAPEGKQFANWEIGSTEYDEGDEITLSESITVTAIWENIPEPPTEPLTTPTTEPEGEQ